MQAIAVAGSAYSVTLVAFEERRDHVEFRLCVGHCSGAQWDVWRRFSEFWDMHDELTRALAEDPCLGISQNGSGGTPGASDVLPEPPPKQWHPSFLHAYDEEFCQQRLQDLQTYLRDLLSIPKFAKQSSVQKLIGTQVPEALFGVRVVHRDGWHWLEIRPCIDASSAIDGYNIIIEGDDGAFRLDFTHEVGDSGMRVQRARVGLEHFRPGQYDFTVAAWNYCGESPPVTVQVRVPGAAPTQENVERPNIGPFAQPESPVGRQMAPVAAIEGCSAGAIPISAICADADMTSAELLRRNSFGSPLHRSISDALLAPAPGEVPSPALAFVATTPPSMKATRDVLEPPLRMPTAEPPGTSASKGAHAAIYPSTLMKVVREPQAQQYTKGEQVQVFSASAQQWLDGTVDEAFYTDCVFNGYNIRAGTLLVRYSNSTKYVLPEEVGTDIRKELTPMPKKMSKNKSAAALGAASPRSGAFSVPIPVQVVNPAGAASTPAQQLTPSGAVPVPVQVVNPAGAASTPAPQLTPSGALGDRSKVALRASEEFRFAPGAIGTGVVGTDPVRVAPQIDATRRLAAEVGLHAGGLRGFSGTTEGGDPLLQTTIHGLAYSSGTVPAVAAGQQTLQPGINGFARRGGEPLQQTNIYGVAFSPGTVPAVAAGEAALQPGINGITRRSGESMQQTNCARRALSPMPGTVPTVTAGEPALQPGINGITRRSGESMQQINIHGVAYPPMPATVPTVAAGEPALQPGIDGITRRSGESMQHTNIHGVAYPPMPGTVPTVAAGETALQPGACATAARYPHLMPNGNQSGDVVRPLQSNRITIHQMPTKNIACDRSNYTKPAINEEEELCAVCFVSKKTHAFVPCGHKCVCAVCGDTLVKKAHAECPICRMKTECVIQIYA